MREVIANRYEVREILHEGGLKTVFRVRDSRAPDRLLVLKLLSEADSDGRALMRFNNEHRVASDLIHPGVCRVVAHGIDPETRRPYFVEDAARGCRLSELPERPTNHLLRDIMAHTARVLSYLHAREIVHFDVKPDNIVVELAEDGNSLIGLKLLDFDLAASVGPVESGRGTMPFVAPEVLDAGEIIDGRADLYSLGATLFSLLTGDPRPDLPLVADVDDLLQWLPEGTALEYDHYLLEALNRLLRPIRDERFASAHEFLQFMAEKDEEVEIETVDSRLASILRPRFIARHEELARLRELAPQPRDSTPRSDVGRPPFVVVSGERGVGKSRLVERYKTELRASRCQVMLLASARGSADGGVTTLSNLELEIESALGKDAEASATRSEAFPDISDPRRFTRFSALTRGLIRLSNIVSPVIVCVEDAESLDPIAGEFLAYLLRRLSAESQLASSPLALQVLITMTPGHREDAALQALFTEMREDGLLELISLSAFDQTRSRELLDVMLAPRHCPAAVAETLFHKTHGNALFLRETVASLQVRANSVQDDAVAFSLDRVKAAPVATKVRGVIQSRVSHVEDRDLFLLQLVALHPKSLDHAHLARFSGLDTDSAAASVDRLSRRGLLSVSPFGELTFVDADTKGVVEDMMTEERRRSLHAQLARALHDDNDPTAWFVVYHELLSGHVADSVWDRAYSSYERLISRHRDAEARVLIDALRVRSVGAPRYLRFMATVSAVELACRRGDSEGARDELRRTELDDPTESPICARFEAQAFVMQGDFDRARDVLLRAARGIEARDPAGASLLVLQRAKTHLEEGSLNDADEVLAEAADMLRAADALPEFELAEDVALKDVASPPIPSRSPYSESQAQWVRLRASLEFRRHHLSGALALGLLSLRMEARSGNLQGLGQGRQLVGSIYMEGGDHESAETYFRSAVSLQRDIGDLLALADTLNNLGILKRNRGNTQEALDDLREALRIRQEIGNREGEYQCLSNIANIHLRRRELPEAAKHLNICVKIKRKLKGNKNPAINLNALGAVAQFRDRFAAALRFYRDAVQADREFGQELRSWYWETNAGLVLAAVGLWSEAKEALTSAREAMLERGLETEPAIALWGLADVARGCGDLESAEEQLDEALQVFTRERDESSRCETLVRLFSLQLAKGDLDEAAVLKKELEEAQDEFLADEVLAKYVALRLDYLIAVGDIAREDTAPEIDKVVQIARTARKLEMPGQAFQAAAALARYERAAGRLDRAFYYANSALGHLESVMAAVHDPRHMEAYLQTPDVQVFLSATMDFVAASSQGRPGEVRRWPDAVQKTLRDLKTGLFDLERVLSTSVAAMRPREDGVRRVLEISQSMTTTMPMEQLLPQILDGAIDFSNAERGFLILVEANEDPQIAVSRTNLGEAVLSPSRQVSRKVIERVVGSQRPVLLQNAMDDEDFAKQESVLNLELRSIMCVPMLRNGKLLGMIYVDNRSRVGEFKNDDLELLGILASQAAVAFENARLVRELVREEKDRTMGVLAGSVAHDFNNLLAAIMGRTQLLQGKVADADALADLETILKAARDGAIVVRRLQDFSQVTKKRDLEVVDLCDIVDDVLEFTKTRWQSEYIRSGRRVEIENRLEVGVLVRGNPAELREVFTNVLLNAVAAMRRSGHVFFESEVLEDTARLIVRLEGESVVDPEREGVFDPLLSNRDREGSLGMSVAYGILMRHGGRVSIESDVDGLAFIVIELPRDVEISASRVGGQPFREIGESSAPITASGPSIHDRAEGVGRAKRTLPAGTGVGRRLLVVDDEMGIRALLDEILRKEGYEVVAADSGDKAVEALEAGTFDLVLTDLGMVPMSGWDVAREAKRRYPETPVILLTGWAEEIGAENARLRQVDRVLSKPFEITDLILAIDEALAAEAEG